MFEQEAIFELAFICMEDSLRLFFILWVWIALCTFVQLFLNHCCLKGHDIILIRGGCNK